MVSNEEAKLLREAYERDGVVVVKKALGSDLRDQLRSAIEWAECHPSPMQANLAQAASGTFINDFLTYKKNIHVHAMLQSEALLDLGSQVVGTTSIRLFHDHILIKRGDAPETPWHQDRPYYLVEGAHNYSIWMPLGDVPADEGLAFLPGSQNTSKLYMPVDFRSGDQIGELNEPFHILNENELARLKERHGELSFDMELGDVLIFDQRIVHMARRTRETFERAALSVRYLGDGCRMTWVGINQTPPFHRMGLDFNEGDTPPAEWFPVLREPI